MLTAVRAFGFDLPLLEPRPFVDPRSIVRFGVPPFRIEVMTSIDGVEYDGCRQRAVEVDIDGLPVPVISLADLKTNKRAAGRHKDLADHVQPFPAGGQKVRISTPTTSAPTANDSSSRRSSARPPIRRSPSSSTG